ncbi:WxL domain-containing protein [Weissella confusa]|uniref:WxL domain-containing protein n=1 Tax=Weissella confusa TaxID=1583 RepID=A0A923NF09_WEICO|nr:WxL domain-containing protein [Weissella confusa]
MDAKAGTMPGNYFASFAGSADASAHTDNGVSLDVPANAALADTYKTTLTWTLTNAPVGNYIPAYTEVSDKRAVQSGWHLAVKQDTDFTGSKGAVLKGAALKLVDPAVSELAGGATSTIAHQAKPKENPDKPVTPGTDPENPDTPDQPGNNGNDSKALLKLVWATDFDFGSHTISSKQESYAAQQLKTKSHDPPTKTW